MKTFVGFFNRHQEIKRTKRRWLGHTLRKPADNVTRRGLWWTPQGKRKRGRPKTIWRRSTEAKAKAAGLTWGQLEWKAQDGGGDGKHRWTTYVPYGTTRIKSRFGGRHLLSLLISSSPPPCRLCALLCKIYLKS